MSTEVEIRESVQNDSAAIESIYPHAFPDEDLLPVVRSLLSDESIAMSLVATIDTQIVGHAIFTKCSIAGNPVAMALLAPLAVTPARQRQGIGSALVRAGLRRMADDSVDRVFVLGDPAYYGRLGFVAESGVKPPYPLPTEYAGAWQSQDLAETPKPCTGTLSVPEQWRQPALWAP